GGASGNADDVVILVEGFHQVDAAAIEHPGVDHPLVQAERQRSAEREGRVLADVIVRGGVTHLDGAAGRGIDGLQAGNDLAGGKDLDLEAVVGRFGDCLGENLGGAVDGVE